MARWSLSRSAQLYSGAGLQLIALGASVIIGREVAYVICGIGVLFFIPATREYLRRKRSQGRLFIAVREGDPWVQVNQGTDRSSNLHRTGFLYTYRIAVGNGDHSPIRNVEVKLTSLGKKPADFHAIGSHLMLRHDRIGTSKFSVPPHERYKIAGCHFH